MPTINDPVLWISPPPAKCDLCEAPVKEEFYDCRVPRFGCWANVCPTCFKREGCSLGTGYGQQFQHRPDGTWLKVAG